MVFGINNSIRMNSLKKQIKHKLPFIIRLRDIWSQLRFNYMLPLDLDCFGFRDKDSHILLPAHIANPQNVYMYEQTRIQSQAKIITYTGKFIMKKYSGAAPGLTVITGNHTPTVGIPYYLLPLSRINDKEKDVIIEEDVWLGANVTLLSGVTIGRGAVIGASSVITKDVPPYAVVVGSPYKIIASKFSLEEIMEHERRLYPESERFSEEYLTQLFDQYYIGMRSIGKTMTTEDEIQYKKFLESINQSI